MQSSLVHILLNLISVIPTMLIITVLVHYCVPQNQLLIEEHWVMKAWMGIHSLLLWHWKDECSTAPSTGCHHHLHFSVGLCMKDAPIQIPASVIMWMPGYSWALCHTGFSALKHHAKGLVRNQSQALVILNSKIHRLIFLITFIYWFWMLSNLGC